MKKIVLIVGALVVLGVIVLVATNGFQKPSTNQESTVVTQDKSSLNADETIKLIEAVSYMENLKIDVALPLLEKLLQQHPENASLLQNKAIALLTRISTTNEQLADSSLSQEEVARLRATLPTLFEQADETISQARAIEPDNVDLARLDITLEERRIAQLPDVMEAPLKQRLIEQILNELKRFAGDAVLTAKLSTVAESLGELSPDLQSKVMTALEVALKENPRNGYLISSLIRLKETSMDLSLVDWVEQAVNIAKPQSWLMKLQANGVDLSQELLNSAANAKTDPDTFFAAAAAWTNVFVRTSIQRSDAETTADIEPLSLIRLEQAYKQYKATLSPESIDVKSLPIADQPSYTTSNAVLEDGSPIIQVDWFDWNIDLKPELLVARGQTVGAL